MKPRKTDIASLAVLAATTLVVAACGGGGGGQTDSPMNSAPMVSSITDKSTDQDMPVSIDFSRISFAEPAFLWLLAIPLVLAVVWAWRFPELRRIDRFDELRPEAAPADA